MRQDTGDLFDAGFEGLPPTIEMQARAFHAENPHVAIALMELAEALRKRGHNQYGIAGLFEVLRYRHSLETRGDEFKLNNNFRAFYARLLMRQYPWLDGFFETRIQKTGAPDERG